MAHDVFISHSAEDKPAADAVCAALESARLRCWIAPRDVTPGADWPVEIMKGLSASKVLVLVFSSHADASSHVRREVQYACSRGLVIIPFRVEKVDPTGGMEFFLGAVHWLDALTPPMERHHALLVNAVRAALSVVAGSDPAPVPPPPARVTEPAASPEEFSGSTISPPTCQDGTGDRRSSAPAGNQSPPSRRRWPIPVLLTIIAGLVLAHYWSDLRTALLRGASASPTPALALQPTPPATPPRADNPVTAGPTVAPQEATPPPTPARTPTPAPTSPPAQPDGPSVDELNKRGVASYQRKHWDEAIGFFTQAYHLAPEDNFALNYLGIVNTNRRQYEAAIEWLDKAVKNDPQDTVALCNRGIAYYYQKKYAPATTDFEAAIKLDPRSRDAHGYLGIVLHLQGHNEQAIEHLNQSIGIDPANTFYLDYRSKAYRALNRLKEAARDEAAIKKITTY